jgi:hypothetical protein
MVRGYAQSGMSIDPSAREVATERPSDILVTPSLFSTATGAEADD